MHETELTAIQMLFALETDKPMSADQIRIVKLALESVYTNGKIEGIRQMRQIKN